MARRARRWWESDKNLGLKGSVAAALIAAAAWAVIALIPVRHWAAAVWFVLVYPVPVPLTILVAAVAALVLLATRVFRDALGPAPPAWLNYREDTFLEILCWSYEVAPEAAERRQPFRVLPDGGCDDRRTLV